MWTAGTLALTVALAAQSMGFASGFGPATFRAVQLFALLLAPLWLAWGLVEMVWPGEAARFGTRLVCGALTVVGSVILATDPLTAAPFGKGWPLAGPHYQPPSHYALDVVQALAVILAAASIGLAAARARTEGPWPGTLPGAAAVGLAVFLTVGLRFSLPSRSAYPLLSLVAAALVWFGATRLEAQLGRPARAGTERSRSTGRSRAAGRDRTTGRDRTAGPTRRDVIAWWAVTRPDVTGRAARPRTRRTATAGRGPPATFARPVTCAPPGSLAGGPTPADDRPARPGRTGRTGRTGGTGRTGRTGRAAAGARPGPDGRPLAPPRMPPRDTAGPATPGAAEAEFAPPARPELPAAPPYGRILIFTLLDDRDADFDRLAEQAAEEVRTREPDTLVYVIHLVPNAPMQRIFYEIYRDRAAFDSHENQPYMQRFVADRRACVLATNVIELRLKYAKVAPLPSPQQPPPSRPPRRSPLPPASRAGPAGAGPPLRARPQSLEPLPPRPDRRMPSGDRRYGGT